MLDNSHGEAFSDQPFFNADFIKANKIKRITGHYSTKASMDVIRENDLIYVYEFDSLGRMIEKYETVNLAGGKDTIVNIYEYDKNNNLINYRKSDQHGFYSTHYEYDSLNRVVKTEYRRDMSKGRDRVHFKLDKSYVITYETSSYENSEGMEKRVYYNSYRKPFQTKFTYTDKNGYVVRDEERLTVHSGLRNIYYKYNPKGLLAEVSKTSNVMGKHTSKIIFKYDDFNNLLSKDFYKNGVHKTEYQIIYDPQTKMISAVLTRNVSDNFITILKFDQIDFFGNENSTVETTP